jgi:hypothetical protein
VHIDCDSCEVRGGACGDCVVTFLLGSAPQGVELDSDERAALEVLADCGLVPPLRLVPPAPAVTSGHENLGRGNVLCSEGHSMTSAG